MRVFGDYARYYDLFYADKDYNAEADYIDSLITRYSRIRAGNILDLGCGTCTHAFLLEKKGYVVTGIDRSQRMLSIAKAKAPAGSSIRFYRADMADFDLDMKFDVVISLFHALGYQTANESLAKTFRNAYRHLKKGGLFIFDFWYGPAVLTDRPQPRARNIRDNSLEVRRISRPSLNTDENIVDIKYEIRAKDKRAHTACRITELHRMRYFFLPELKFFLSTAGFKMRAQLKWMSLNKRIGPLSWYGLIIAEK